MIKDFIDINRPATSKFFSVGLLGSLAGRIVGACSRHHDMGIGTQHEGVSTSVGDAQAEVEVVPATCEQRVKTSNLNEGGGAHGES